MMQSSNETGSTPLDKRAGKLLKLLKRQPAMSGQTAVEVRAQLGRAGNPFPAQAADLAYTIDHTVQTAGGASLLLREYSPVRAGSDSHAILFFHGGGFVSAACPSMTQFAGCSR